MNRPRSTHDRSPGSLPGALPVTAALDASEALGALLVRVQESRRRFDTAVAPLLLPPLRATVRPGPLDDQAWLLLAEHPAAAAKLRQLLPQLRNALEAAGWREPAIKVKVQPRG